MTEEVTTLRAALKSAKRLLETAQPHLQGCGWECCGNYAWCGDPQEPPQCCGRPYDLADVAYNEIQLLRGIVGDE